MGRTLLGCATEMGLPSSFIEAVRKLSRTIEISRGSQSTFDSVSWIIRPSPSWTINNVGMIVYQRLNFVNPRYTIKSLTLTTILMQILTITVCNKWSQMWKFTPKWCQTHSIGWGCREEEGGQKAPRVYCTCFYASRILSHWQKIEGLKWHTELQWWFDGAEGSDRQVKAELSEKPRISAQLDTSRKASGSKLIWGGCKDIVTCLWLLSMQYLLQKWTIYKLGHILGKKSRGQEVPKLDTWVSINKKEKQGEAKIQGNLLESPRTTKLAPPSKYFERPQMM